MSIGEANDEVFRTKKLLRAGQLVRSKMYYTLWRVIGKREIWQHPDNHPRSGKGVLIPAIYLAFCKIQKGVMPGVEKMFRYTYTLYDNTFESNLEIVENR